MLSAEGRITEKEIRDHISKETLFYICGPPPMTDFFSKELESSRVPREHICFEKWWEGRAEPGEGGRQRPPRPDTQDALWFGPMIYICPLLFFKAVDSAQLEKQEKSTDRLK